MDRICCLFDARRRFLHTAAAVVALVAWPLATEAKDKLLDETVELSGAVLFAETKVPALIVGVVRNGETSVFGFGKIGAAEDRAPDGKTLLRIGSITKAFTGAVLASLVGDGVVKLTDPLQSRLGWNVQIPTKDGKAIHTKPARRSVAVCAGYRRPLLEFRIRPAGSGARERRRQAV